MAGGRMALYSGLIVQIDPSDDEIAPIMGLEIALALANLTAAKMSLQLASSAGIIAIGIASDNTGAAMAAASAAAIVAVTMPNSRAAETEADQIGIELAAKAGYDPAAAVTLWQKMGDLPGGQPPQFLSTHPSPESRVKELAALGPLMQPWYRADTVRTTHAVQTVSSLN